MENARRQDDIDFIALWDILLENWTWVVGISAGFAVAAVIYALVATEMYRASTVVSEITNQGDRMSALASQYGGLAGLAGIDLGQFSADSGNARPILESRSLVEEFVRRHDVAAALFPERIGSDEPPTQWETVEAFREDVLTIADDPGTGLVVVSIEWIDPELAARWANDFVKLANELIRAREVQHAETSLAFLNAEIAESSVVELQRVLYGLVESELKTLMFANAREDFAFETIDSAVVPEKRFRPRRTLIVILGTLLGGIVSLFVVLGRELVSQQRLARATGRLRSN